jgi:ribosomal protein L7Ae-like RNA K-turn-binding protein
LLEATQKTISSGRGKLVLIYADIEENSASTFLPDGLAETRASDKKVESMGAALSIAPRKKA